METRRQSGSDPVIDLRCEVAFIRGQVAHLQEKLTDRPVTTPDGAPQEIAWHAHGDGREGIVFAHTEEQAREIAAEGLETTSGEVLLVRAVELDHLAPPPERAERRAG